MIVAVGFARRLWYQAGFRERPKLEAIRMMFSRLM
jgi:hypothetical protein